MRFKIEIETANTDIPIDYRGKFISYLKGAIEDYDQDLFKVLYGGGHNFKHFCLSIYFVPEVIILKEQITLHSKRFILYLSTYDVLIGVHLFNALLARKNKWFPLADCNNQLKTLSIVKVQEYPITSNIAHFKILSPVVIRDHSREGRDWYITYEDEDFEKIWKRNLKTELQNTFSRDVSGDIDALCIKSAQFRKTVVKNYGIYIPCTIGSMVLEGEKYLLEYFYKAGIGSKRALLFGCLDLMRGGVK